MIVSFFKLVVARGARGRRWLALPALSLLGACGTAPSPGTAEPTFAADSATVRVAPNPAYARRGWWWQHLWGRHYRTLWATPVATPVLRLGAAGLQPQRLGGSFQTSVLHLRAADGSSWVLRSVDKDLSRGVDAGWLDQAIAPVLRDQTCAAPPYGALVAAQLAQAAGIEHPHPRLVYLLPDTALGALAARLPPALYLLEKRPAGPAAGVVGSGAMLAQLLGSHRARLAARAYLRARLLDLLVGDWSRRADQWRWQVRPAATGPVFEPIPRDRDQAFFRFDDGWLTRGISWVRPRYQTFSAHLTPADVRPLTVTARALDHTALAWLPEAAFAAEADSLACRLPDAVLRRALAAVPAEARPLLQHDLLAALRERRAALPAVARRFYQVLQQEPVLTGTDAAERFELLAAGPGGLRLRAWARRPPRPDSLLGERVFDVRRTTRLTVYGLGGNDVFELRGSLQPGFGVHLHGGAGRNQFRQQEPGQAQGPGLTIYTTPADLVQVGAGVRRRPGPAEAATPPWLARTYRLGTGARN